MEFEQIINQLDWLDNEHRKDKQALSALQEQMDSLTAGVNVISQQIKDLSKLVAEVTASAVRANQFDEMLTRLRSDLNKAIDNQGKKYQQRETDANKRHASELEGMNKVFTELRTLAAPDELKKRFKEQSDETKRLSNNVNDLTMRIKEALDASRDVIHEKKVADDLRVKQLAEIRGEVESQRKHSDENREKASLHEDKIRSIENRLTDLFNSEQERNKAQSVFLEEQTHAQLERDRGWKEWRSKYADFLEEGGGLAVQVQTLNETLRAAKRAQETYLELNTKLERRISEVMELQRLAEERLRQEWVTFKAEDQKRWTGNTLSTEESIRDLRNNFQKMEKRLSLLDDLAQTMQDQLHQTTDTTEEQLQEMMNIVHQWMTSYERIMGHNKKPIK
jgi:chromosome segregation ATPase